MPNYLTVAGAPGLDAHLSKEHPNGCSTELEQAVAKLLTQEFGAVPAAILHQAINGNVQANKHTFLDDLNDVL